MDRHTLEQFRTRGAQGRAARGRARVRAGRGQGREGRARPRPAQATPRATGRHTHAGLRARRRRGGWRRSGVSWRKRPHEPPVRREGQLVCAHRLRGGHRGGERLAAGARQDVRRAHQLERRRGPRGHRRRPDDDLHRSQPHLYGRQRGHPHVPPRGRQRPHRAGLRLGGRGLRAARHLDPVGDHVPARREVERPHRELHRRLREPAPQRAP